MLTLDELKRRACAAIESRRKEIIDVSRQVLANPEAGFRETKTAALVSQKFHELGITHQTGLAMTGVKGRFPGGAGPRTRSGRHRGVGLLGGDRAPSS